MDNYSIRSFPNYVLRTPSFPVTYYLNLVANYSLDITLETIEEPFFKEAIRLASPEFLGLLDKLKKNSQYFPSEKKKALVLTLLKYIARISSRCTPFGLFAGCTVGNFERETNIILKSNNEFERFTQFDMQFWISFLKKIETENNFRQEILYYPNNSIYSFGDFYRYIEYKYKNKKREHAISALRKTDFLDHLLKHCNNGSTINKMVVALAHDESEQNEALYFVEKLIEFQFFVSELESGLTGNDEWERVTSVISKIPNTADLQKIIYNFKKKIQIINRSLFNVEDTYSFIKKTIEKANFEYDDKYLFQADLNTKTLSNKLNDVVSKKIKETLFFLNSIQKKRKHDPLENFKRAFLHRYETREMLLTTVLDTEIGIGYLQDNKANDDHNLLEDFSFPNRGQNSIEEQWTNFDLFLENKLKTFLNDEESFIVLSKKDFTEFDTNCDNVPATFSVMVEIIREDDIEIISLESSGNTSAAKLLGRFCNGNEDIHKLTKQIILKEEEYHKDKITAEIVHIPESRTGNILKRPVLRPYEIPYLSNTSVNADFKIEISDLTITIINDRIVLKSKKHNKEVVPFLSNAHNYSVNSLPIYHFLCDLQYQDIKPIHNFSWGVLESHYDFFPRIYYQEVIISKAKWFITQKEIQSFLGLKENLFQNFIIWKKDRNIPRFVNWVDYDNTLLLDLDQEICVKLFFRSIKNFNKVILEEFLFADKSIVTNELGENFANQFIVSFYKEKKK
ncbi:MAG: lantibiotic dehydratase family protein [Flavobacterium sp.]|uniref:lantibiotic dehydratase family protein n=1 Tax=Flavobacterium sp. TaxID=239 RepID=UPI003267F200